MIRSNGGVASKRQHHKAGELNCTTNIIKQLNVPQAYSKTRMRQMIQYMNKHEEHENQRTKEQNAGKKINTQRIYNIVDACKDAFFSSTHSY